MKKTDLVKETFLKKKKLKKVISYKNVKRLNIAKRKIFSGVW